MKTSRIFSAIFLCMGISSFALADVEGWSAASHVVYVGDYDGKNGIDYLVRANKQSAELPGPYEITFDVQHIPGMRHALLEKQSDSSFSLLYEQVEEEKSLLPVWMPSGHQFVIGDFTGDDISDVVLQPLTAAHPSFLMNGVVGGGVAPKLLKTYYTEQELGVALRADASTLTVNDANNDGLDDLIIANAGQSYTAFSNGAGFYRALKNINCMVGGLLDTDCDGVPDIYDAFPLNAEESADTDGDGIGNNADTDDDNDGVPDISDSSPLDSMNGVGIGVLTGDFVVTEAGKANYTIPVHAVPGAGSVTPSLDLVYSQDSGNGLLGVGWYLSGLSQIQRCANTYAQDGYINGVNYDVGDGFCLNGHRLLQTTGKPGAKGDIEFKTEQESYSRIVGHSIAKIGFESFTVWRKDGKKEIYGGAANSRAIGGSGAAGKIHTFALSRVEDRLGNYADYTYEKATDNFYIKTIDYGKNINASSVPVRHVLFQYEARPDKFVKYTDGVKRVIGMRLKRIETSLDTQLVRSYTMVYANAGINNRSTIGSITECYEVVKSCLPSTVFSWQQDAASDEGKFTHKSEFSKDGQPAYVDQQQLLGDVNGDGIADLVWTYMNVDVLGWNIFYGSSTGSFSDTSVSGAYDTNLNLTSGNFQAMLGDVNGDGLADLVWAGTKNITNDNGVTTISLLSDTTPNTSVGFKPQALQTFSSRLNLKNQFQLADINGDGRQDILYIYYWAGNIGVDTFLSYNNGTSMAYKRTEKKQWAKYDPQHYQYNQFLTGDINGDGKTDFAWMFVYDEKIYRAVFLANAVGDGFDNLSLQRDTNYNYRNDFSLQGLLADIDGDGKSDFIYSYEKKNADQMCWRVYRADIEGTSFGDNNGKNPKTVSPQIDDTSTCRDVGAISLHRDQQMQLVDINGDDRLDLVYSYREGDATNAAFKWKSFIAGYDAGGFVVFSDRQNGSQRLSVSATATAHRINFADITGDGKADLVQTYNSGTDMRAQTFTQPKSYPEHISQITNGWNEIIKLKYDFLSSTPDLYTKSAASAYPYRTDAGLSYVVSNVTRSDGIGGWRSWGYTYKDATTHLLGRGFLGFAERTVKDNQRNLLTTYTYRLKYPYLGKLSSEVVTNLAVGSKPVVSATYNHWKSQNVAQTNGAKTQSVYLADTVSLRNDLITGDPISAVVTENEYDNNTGYMYGTLTKSVVSTGHSMSSGVGAGFDILGKFTSGNLSGLEGKVTTTNIYANDIIANWRLGFLTNTAVAAERNGALSNKTYTHNYTPYNSTSFLVGVKTEFAGSNVQRATTYGYDSFGNVTSESVTTSDYGGGTVGPYLTTFGQYIDGLYPSSKTNAAGHQEKYQYDLYIGKANQVTDANNLTTWMKFDGFGHELLRQTPDGAQTINSYAPCVVSGCVYTVTTTMKSPSDGKLGAPQKTTMVDMLGRVKQESTKGFNDAPIPVYITYNNLGQKETVSEPGSSAVTTYMYDVQDRVTSETEPDGGSKTISYSADTGGSKVEVHAQVLIPTPDESKNINTTTWFNTYGQMTQTLQTLDGVDVTTLFAYDAQGYLRSAQAAGITTTITTDVAGNKIQLVDPDAGSIQYQYDGLGRARLEIQPMGHTTLTGYDGLNRVTSKVYSGVGSPQNMNWVYDTVKKGQLTSANGPNYHKTLAYDNLSRVQSESIMINGEATAKLFTYGYDHYSRISQKTWPSGFAVKYGFNANGYAQTVQDAGNDTLYWQATAMDARGNVTGESFGNGVITSKAFDPTNGLAKSIRTGTADNPTAFQNLSYIWDTAGNLYQRTSASSGTAAGLGENYAENFTYDNWHRLLTANTTGSFTRNLSYTYYPNGNIDSKTGVGTYTYDAYPRPHAVRKTVGAVNATYDYDDKGNMTKNGNRILTYSVFNLPLTIDEGDTNTKFLYGPEEKLIWQETTQNAIKTETRYYEGDYEEVQQGDTIRAKTSVNGIVVYSTVKKAGSQATSSDLSYLHTDHLGSTDSVTGKTAQLDTRMLFDPFGFRRQASGADADAAYLATLQKATFETTAKGYTGHEQIDSASLVHMGGRMYDPVLGRFLSPDDYVQFPEISQSYNRYSYVMNNPLSRVDPSGEVATCGEESCGGTTATTNLSSAELSAEIDQWLARGGASAGNNNTDKNGGEKASGSDSNTSVTEGVAETHAGLIRAWGEGLVDAGKMFAKEAAMMYGGAKIFGGSGSAVDDLVEGLGKKSAKNADEIAKVENSVFHRLGDSSENIENIKLSGELRGNPATNTYASDIPKVKAYAGKLPEGKKGFEFTTDAVPDKGGHPYQPTWSGNGKNPDVRTENGKAVISCTVTKTNC